MNVQNLSIGDFGTKANGLGPNWQTVSVPAVVSFDVVWSGPITRQVTVTNGTLGNQYAGDVKSGYAPNAGANMLDKINPNARSNKLGATFK